MVNRETLIDIQENQDIIYHYTSYSIGIENILGDHSLKLTSLCNTHDPLEFTNFQHGIFAPATQEDKFQRCFEMHSEINEYIKNNCKMMCFSIDYKYNEINNLDPFFHKGFAKSRMWSQYGESHKGMCFIFDRKRLMSNLQNDVESIQVPIGTSITIHSGKVEYDNSLAKLKIALTTNPYKLTDFEKYIHDNLEGYLFLKLEDYRDEQEYRIVLYSKYFNNKDEVLINYLDSLEGIILGCKFPQVYIEMVMEFCKRLKVNLYYLFWSNGEPYLETIYDSIESLNIT